MEKMSKVEALQKAYQSYLESINLTHLLDPDPLSPDSANIRVNTLQELKSRLAKRLQIIDHLANSYLLSYPNSFDSLLSYFGELINHADEILNHCNICLTDENPDGVVVEE